jgi:polyisoprenoid-binding protein YceI
MQGTIEETSTSKPAPFERRKHGSRRISRQSEPEAGTQWVFTRLRNCGIHDRSATLHLKLQSKSVTGGSRTKDKEVKGKHSFKMKEFPEIKFVPSKMIPGPDALKFVMEGKLTMRGVTRPVTVMITVHPVVDGRQMIDGEIAFNRRDFGMTHSVPSTK